jgi:opacity protein-like surface antigen
MPLRLPFTALLACLLFACVLFARPAHAHAQGLADYDYENLSFRGFGFAYGRIWPSKVEPATSWTLRVDLGYLGPAVRITPFVSYWISDVRRGELEELADKLEQLPPLSAEGVQLGADDLGPIRWSDMSAGIDAQIVWTAPLRTLTYVGGGIAAHALNGRGDVIANTFIEDLLDSTTAGFALMAGLENQPVPRLRIFGEARYTMLSDVRYPELKIGGAFLFPAHAATQGAQ